MALTKERKKDIVGEVSDLLGSSKMTVIAKYQGTTVKALQALRRDAKTNGTTVRVIKNRLVIQAIRGLDNMKQTDTSALEGMLLYAFNGDDEVGAAQSLNNFARLNPTLEFVGAISQDGSFADAATVKALANLPGKNQLLAGLINTLQSPLRGISSSLSGNLHGLLQGLEAKAQ